MPTPETRPTTDTWRIGALPQCPSCRSMRLRAVSDGEDTNFLCLECGTCWHLELGWVHRVEPADCPGCPSRSVCTAALTTA